MKSRILNLILLLVFLPLFIHAQTLPFLSNSEIFIEGTSNVHDWTAEITSYEGSVIFDQGQLNGVELKIPVRAIDSGKGGMDKRIYAALEDKKFEFITFKSSKIEQGDSDRLFLVTGDLTIHGVTKSVTLNVEREDNGEEYLFLGSYSTVMTEFNIDPPSAMFGAFKAGNDISIFYSIYSSKPADAN